MNNRPFVYPFKTYGANYIYDVNRNTILKTTKEVWNMIKESDVDLISSDKNKNEYSLINKLKEDGFLSSNRVNKIIHPMSEIVEDYLNSKILMLDLQVTQQCNFRCEYCPYSGGYNNREHTNQRMTFEIAKKGIDFLIAHSSEQKQVFVGFYGGEPLIEFNLIKQIVEYIKNNIPGKQIMYTITTNGTLLNENILDFFRENDVQLAISLDGPKEIHDKSRKFAFNNCGTFDKVIEKVNLIKQNYPEYMKRVSFNAVIDPQQDVNCVCEFFSNFETVKEAFLTYSEIAENYSKKEINVDEQYYQQMNYEYFKLLLSKLNKLDKKYISKLVSKRFSDLETAYRYLRTTEKLPEQMHHAGPCIPGAQRLFLNAYGDFYPCERVSETSPSVKIGNVEQGLDINKIINILNIGKLTEEQCKNCWAIRFCSLCVAAADNGSEFSKELKLKKCIGSKKMAENKIKDICVLKEFGYTFKKEKDFH